MSHSSTKTLATSDMETGSPDGEGRRGDDNYGFSTTAAVSQRERLAKRNDSIRKNLSTKTEENKKNKRPSKLSKSKSKSKSQSLDQLNENNSNNSSNQKESRQTAKLKEKSGKSYITPKDSADNKQTTSDKSAEKAADRQQTENSQANQLSI